MSHKLVSLYIGEGEYYTRTDADKVIAEKDKEIQRLENLCESYRIDCDNLAIREANAYKEIERDNKQLRHHKYKRCLAMHDYCLCELEFAFRDPCIERSTEGCVRWRKWVNRWYDLAEMFKEA